MNDTVITIVAIFLGTILLFIFPLMSVSERSDDISQLTVQTATSEFATAVTTKGKISLTDYQKLISTLSATGNSYDVEMEVKILDENIGKKSAWTSGTVIGENSSYSIGTTSIVEEITQKGSYSLKEGDVFIVRVKNTNKTLAQTIRGAIYTVAGSDNYSIAAEASGMVQANGSN